MIKTRSKKEGIMTELLAPAGSLAKLKVAFAYGADAVYFGGELFSLRARASNLRIEEIAEAARFAHAQGKKVYVTVNIIPHDEDFAQARQYFALLAAAGVDAVIVSSLALFDLAGELIPAAERHMSTQLSVLNSAAAQFWQAAGAQRVVLGRELSFAELERLKAKTSLDLEVFIHGGMCSAYSGRCVLSNYLAHRDANRGGCAHCCRWDYAVAGAPDFKIASYDLNALGYVKSVAALGVKSLKIEGRMKSEYYIAGVVKAYRDYLDGRTSATQAAAELAKVDNRLATSGFYSGRAGRAELLLTGDVEPSKQFVGKVLGYDPAAGRLKIEQRNYFACGDTLEALTPGQENSYFLVEALYDEAGQALAAARHPQQIVYVPSSRALAPGSFLRLASHPCATSENKV